jgi:hypothetical protein
LPNGNAPAIGATKHPPQQLTTSSKLTPEQTQPTKTFGSEPAQAATANAERNTSTTNEPTNNINEPQPWVSIPKPKNNRQKNQTKEKTTWIFLKTLRD